MISQGKIRRTQGDYELFSQEAVNGAGQQAHSGDFFKVDGSGCPFPNEREWFLSHHRRLQGNYYEQLNEPLFIWQYGDPVSEELLYLLKNERLRLNSSDSKRCYEAFLWGHY